MWILEVEAKHELWDNISYTSFESESFDEVFSEAEKSVGPIDSLIDFSGGYLYKRTDYDNDNKTIDFKVYIKEY